MAAVFNGARHCGHFVAAAVRGRGRASAYHPLQSGLRLEQRRQGRIRRHGRQYRNDSNSHTVIFPFRPHFPHPNYSTCPRARPSSVTICGESPLVSTERATGLTLGPRSAIIYFWYRVRAHFRHIRAHYLAGFLTLVCGLFHDKKPEEVSCYENVENATLGNACARIARLRTYGRPFRPCRQPRNNYLGPMQRRS